jgi:hypothetical protein
MSQSPVRADQRNRQHALDQARPGQNSKQKFVRLALTSALILSVLAALIIGVALGNAARKRIDKWGHAYF